ncbi:co-chaperone protein daf-41-like [Rhopilema esculentum]|uniref:co-chaperone protein daf-41-like n=1 Tax=Rhopilema esculentum TaxID=499914 RepID=UPI0031E38A7E
MRTAVNNNQMVREHLRKSKIRLKIESIMYRPLSNASEIKRACSDILTKLQHSFEMTGSGQKKILVPKIDPNHKLSPLLEKDGLPRLSPKTLWSQSKKSITLSIQLRDVRNEIVNITEKRLKFSCSTTGSFYELDLELYAAVDPERSHWRILGGEVLVTLVKAEELSWPRLLLSSLKPPYLHIDFSRWQADGEERHGFLPESLLTKQDGSSNLTGCVPDSYYSDTDSSDDEDSSDETIYDDFGSLQ